MDQPLRYEVMELSADAGVTSSVYIAEPDSRSQEALDVLGQLDHPPDEQPAPAADDAPRAGPGAA
jgi:hypothetical protein